MESLKVFLFKKTYRIVICICNTNGNHHVLGEKSPNLCHISLLPVSIM